MTIYAAIGFIIVPVALITLLVAKQTARNISDIGNEQLKEERQKHHPKAQGVV
jgi:hypothetical protein